MPCSGARLILQAPLSLRTRWFIFLQMLAVGAIAISAPAAFRGDILSFTASFLVLQGLIIYQFASISFYDRSHIKLSSPFLLCYGVAFVLLFISLFCRRQALLPLHLLAIVINMSAPVLSAPHINKTLASRGQQFSGSPALVERFGQFTIIVLTESILSTVIRWNIIVVLLLIAGSIFSKDCSAFGLLLTVFLLLAIPVVVGVVTWLKHEIY